MHWWLSCVTLQRYIYLPIYEIGIVLFSFRQRRSPPTLGSNAGMDRSFAPRLALVYDTYLISTTDTTRALAASCQLHATQNDANTFVNRDIFAWIMLLFSFNTAVNYKCFQKVPVYSFHLIEKLNGKQTAFETASTWQMAGRQCRMSHVATVFISYPNTYP